MVKVSMGEQVKHYVRRRFLGVDVPEEPHFDSVESTSWFLDKLAKSRRYLEYGMGGSTYTAAKLGVPFVAVESDPVFLNAVQEKIQSAGYARSEQVLHYANIGPVGPWGRPVGRMSSERDESFRSYSNIPDQCHDGPAPDLVLVDGRFRVACALKALRQFRADCLIVVDDYADRPHLQVLTEFAEIEHVGRMAVLTKAKPVSAYHLADAISAWETVRD